VREDKQVQALADKFVLLRMTYMRDKDIALFNYDFDQTWMTFFLDGEGRVYSRFGSRDAASAESYNSVDGLVWTMKEVLKLHQDAQGQSRPAYKRPPEKKPGDIPALHALGYGNSCVRCHMIHEAQLAQKRKDPGLQAGDFWLFPPPENIGLKLERTEGNRVQEVLPDSLAAKVGLKVGDRLRTANGQRITTRADLEAVLQGLGSPAKLELVAERGEERVSVEMKLEGDWRRCDSSWRMSVRQTARRILGDYRALSALAADEKDRLKITGDLALRLEEADDGSGAKLPAMYRDAGLQDGDVIVAFDGKRKLGYRFPHFYPMLEHAHGDKFEITFLRDGKEHKATAVSP
jgi:hypothetical protein